MNIKYLVGTLATAFVGLSLSAADVRVVRTDEIPSVAEIAAKLAELRGVTCAELAALADRNADRFLAAVTAAPV